jgi:hypothetical protein
MCNNSRRFLNGLLLIGVISFAQPPAKSKLPFLEEARSHKIEVAADVIFSHLDSSGLKTDEKIELLTMIFRRAGEANIPLPTLKSMTRTTADRSSSQLASVGSQMGLDSFSLRMRALSRIHALKPTEAARLRKELILPSANLNFDCQ